MPSRVLARRIAALITCRLLHQSGELDDNLQPIGKEGFLASEPDWENFELAKSDEDILHENTEPRPGTTKRRQYYYKRVSVCMTFESNPVSQHILLHLDRLRIFGLSSQGREIGVLVSHKNDPSMSHTGRTEYARQKNLSTGRITTRFRPINAERNTKN